MIAATSGLRRWRTSFSVLVGLVVGLVALADFLFYRRVVGWTAGLFLAALLAGLLIRGGRGLRRPAGVILLLATGGLVVALVEHPGALPVLLSALGVVTLALVARGAWQGGVWAWLRSWGWFVAAVPTRLLLDNRLAARWLRRHPRSSRAWTWAPQLWLIPAALGAVFIALFAAANPIISRWVAAGWDALANAFDHLAALSDAPRLGLWLLTGAGVWALLRAKARRKPRPPRPPALNVAPPAGGAAVAVASPGDARVWVGPDESAAPPAHYTLPPRRVTPGVVVRCLVTFNLLFAVQTGLDALYLWGGAELPDGMTWAEYAQRGAYPLVATALLAAAFVLVTFRAGAPTEKLRAARLLVYAWVAQNVLLVVSAAWRLTLYVDAYSLTRLRLAAGVWMGLVALGLVWIVARLLLKRANVWLLNANVLTAAAVLYACGFLNFDGFIADYNVRHCREAGGTGSAIDLDYLRELGPEALPALRRIELHLTDPHQRRAAALAAQDADAELREALADWRGWTYRRHRIAR